MALAGASIVSGSQAHQAHGLEFKDDDTLIMYGLGNLFFDQFRNNEETGKALIARHVFYDGRYLSTELFTTYFVDYAKPRYMTDEEREAFLTNIFNERYLQQKTGKFKGYPFRTFAGGSYLGGYSDHFPVYIYLLKAI